MKARGGAGERGGGWDRASFLENALTLFLAHWEAANMRTRPATSAAPLEGGQMDADNDRTTSWGCFGAAEATASVGNEDIFRAESGSSFSPSL